MIEAVLQKYRSRGMPPYDNWASDSESFFLLQKLWLDIIEQSGVLQGYVADQEVLQIEGSYIISLRKQNKKLLVYSLPRSADYNFDFYLKPVLDDKGNPITDSVLLVIDCKLIPSYLHTTIDILKNFGNFTIDCENDRDNFYNFLYSSYGHLLAYQRDGTLK